MRAFTEKEKQWLIEHYHTMKQCECASHLCCSDDTVRRLAKQLGIYVKRTTHEAGKKKVEVVNVTMCDEGDGYCIYCCHYRSNGHCAKTGKDTGALHKKVCFKEKSHEKSSNN